MKLKAIHSRPRSDWDLASPQSGWKEAAERWRDEYHDMSPSATDIEAGLVEVEHHE